ncbi:MAG: hypothetical protein AAGK02_14500 [Pseudomonadota bacterium]
MLVGLRPILVSMAALLLGGCPPPDGYVASTPPATGEAPSGSPEYVSDASAPALAELDQPEIEPAPDYDHMAAPTRVLSAADAERLRNTEGMTLQWIGWDARSPVLVEVDERGVWMMTSEIRGEGGAALKLEGFVTEIGEDYFLIHAEITIMGTPTNDRFCDVNKIWRFAVTQNRSYYRLREFEWCDGYTDYIDIYFPPSLKSE